MPTSSLAAEKLVGFYSAVTMSMSVPWIAQEAGLFRKHNLDFRLVYIVTTPLVTSAMLGGEGDVAVTGGEGIIRAFIQGASDFVFVGGIKNVLTNSILARPAIKEAKDLKGRRIGVARIGTNPHYFALQALKHRGLDPTRDVTFIQTGGAPDTLAALVSGAIDAATLTAPMDTRAMAQGFHAVISGHDLRLPYVATGIVTRRSTIQKRPAVVGQFMRVMAEGVKILLTDKELTFRVLAQKMRLDDRSVLEAAYAGEVKALEQKLEMRPEAIEAILEEIAKVDPRARKVKAQDLFDRRFIDEMEKGRFFDQVWSAKG
jgi:NitT/TauT family transport system substrate-binding protein